MDNTLSRIQIEQFDEFVTQFKSESNRSAIILSAAKIDDTLYFILKKFLCDSYNKKDDELLDSDSPLATFSSRISICYRLGLIDEEFARKLHLVRKIRNDFAHRIDARLDQSPNKEMIKLIVDSIRNTRLFSDVKNVYFEESDDLISEYFIALIILTINLIILNSRISTLSNINSLSIIPKNY